MEPWCNLVSIEALGASDPGSNPGGPTFFNRTERLLNNNTYSLVVTMVLTDKLAKYALIGGLTAAAATQIPEYERVVERGVEARYATVHEEAESQRDIIRAQGMDLEEYEILVSKCNPQDKLCRVNKGQVKRIKEITDKEQKLEKRVEKLKGNPLQRIAATFYPFNTAEQAQAWDAYSPSISLDEESKFYASVTAALTFFTLGLFDVKSALRQRRRNKYLDDQMKGKRK